MAFIVNVMVCSVPSTGNQVVSCWVVDAETDWENKNKTFSPEFSPEIEITILEFLIDRIIQDGVQDGENSPARSRKK